MSVSMLDLAPRDFPARGAGSNTETTWTPPAPAYTAAGQAIARATEPGYFDWLDHIRAAGGCTRPIRLTGSLSTVDPATGRLLDHRHTDCLPDATIYKACGNRRSTVCPSCARIYQRDAYQLLRAGLVGGKGVPTTVARHPAVFVTLTAPSFGTVHTRTVTRHTCRDRRHCDCRPNPCHARRDTGVCEHGQAAVCWARHDPADPLLGQPLCLDCYDHDHHVVFNLHAAELWHRTKQAAERALAKLCRARGVPPVPITAASGKVRLVPPVRLSHGKAAEMQRRGAIHFHALVRLDGVHPTDPDAVIPPPAGIGLGDLVDVLDAAARDTTFDTPDHPARPGGWPMAWGEQVDVQPLMLAGNGTITDDTVAEQLAAQKAGYLAKYATKSTEATGYTSTRLDHDTIRDHADPTGGHTARLIEACWRLGTPTHGDRPNVAHLLPPVIAPRPREPFREPWTCQECGTRTRYRVCPVCAANRQACLDGQPANSAQRVTGYARLRRWAHMLGYGGHFLTKARRYSVTFRLLRDTRITYRRTRDQADNNAGAVRAVDHLDETTLIVGTLTYAGTGWHTSGDALLANTAADLARIRHEIGREELAHEMGASAPMAIPTAA